MSWRTIILTKDCKLYLRLNHLVVKSDSITRIPLNEIGQVIIDNPNIVMTGHILNALSKQKIMTIICNEKHLPFSQLNLIYGHFRQAKVIKQQLNWQANRKDKLWQYIIRNKIKNQQAILHYFYPSESFNNFEKYIEDVQLNDDANREGHAAKVYFNKLFGLDFRRGSDTPINWALNYGYSLLMSLFSNTIITRGLLTELGIHHRSQFNHYNLTSDFMEVYRPLIDLIVKENISTDFSTYEKQILLNVFNQKIKIKNRNQYLSNSVEIYVDSLIDYMNNGNEEKLSFPIISN